MTLETHNRFPHERSAAGRVSVSAQSLTRCLILTLLLVAVLAQSGCVGLTGADPSDVAFSPAKVDFGEVATGSKKTITVEIKNMRPLPLTLPQATISGESFSFDGLELPATLDPGGVLAFTVTFAPTSTGTAPGTFIVSSEEAGLPPESLSLTGMGLSASGPTITTQPASQSVTVGQSATFVVTASGADPLSYQWKKNGSNIGGATAATYTTPPTSSSDSGSQFTVTVTDSVGTVTSDAAMLTVTTSSVAPSITSQPSNRTVTAGQTASFSVTAAGTAPLSYQWRKNGVNISGAMAASYTTPATAASDNGAQFSVIVTNTVSSVSSRAAALTVNTPVTITGQPSNRTVTAGATATFSVTATGSALTYQWKRNGSNIAGANASSYTTPATTTADNGVQFSVVVTNAAGSVSSNAATLTVNALITITSQPSNQTVTAGARATFSVTATGSSITYQWRKNGANITGANSSSYTTPVTTTGDNGAQFSVRLTSGAGSVTSNDATLTVTSAPVTPSITSQPANRTVISGQTATFSVTATGTAPFTYQWRKNSANISGATAASYTTPVTTTADTGAQFSVIVSNSVSSVTSNSATLTVNAATFLLTSNATNLNFGNVDVGSNKVLTAIISNSGNSNVSISSVGLSGPGFSASGVSSGMTLIPGQSASLNVTFAPNSTGSAAGTVSITSNATNSPVSITLAGSGVQPVQHSSTLSWSPSTSSVTGYYAYRATTSGGPYTKLNSSATGSTSYTDSTVQAGRTYFYVVTSVDSSGVESDYSNEVSGTVPST